MELLRAGQPVATALPPTASPGLQRCYSTGSMQVSLHSQTPSQVTPCATPPAVRFYSGVIRNSDAVPIATVRSATLPQPQGYPQAGMPIMVRHQSTASLRSHHSVERAVPLVTTPKSKDASPRRGSPRGHSQYASRASLAKSVEEETCTSPRSIRSLQSPRSVRSQSRSGSPKGEESNARARSRHNTADSAVTEGEEAPWEVPYAARTGSQSPRAATPLTGRSDSQKRRYHDLYEDHEIRKQKWQAKLEEKKRKEEQELQRGIANTCSPRHFNPEEFHNWLWA